MRIRAQSTELQKCQSCTDNILPFLSRTGSGRAPPLSARWGWRTRACWLNETGSDCVGYRLYAFTTTQILDFWATVRAGEAEEPEHAYWMRQALILLGTVRLYAFTTTHKESAPIHREITENEVYRHVEYGSKIRLPLSKTAENYRNPGYGNSTMLREMITTHWMLFFNRIGGLVASEGG